MSGIASLIALILVMFGRNMRMLAAQLFDEAHGTMRSLMWYKDQKSVCALNQIWFWPLQQRPRHDDRFVLKGLCCTDVVNFLLLPLLLLEHAWPSQGFFIVYYFILFSPS